MLESIVALTEIGELERDMAGMILGVVHFSGLFLWRVEALWDRSCGGDNILNLNLRYSRRDGLRFGLWDSAKFICLSIQLTFELHDAFDKAGGTPC
jgi:hypothetical protein